MKRSARLASARDSEWVEKFEGKHIVRGYRKRFGVDVLCAIAELKMLGVPIDKEYERQVRITVEKEAEAKRRKNQERSEFDEFPDSVDHFAFIAGYTAGGAPSGSTREEMGLEPPDYSEDDEDPF